MKCDSCADTVLQTPCRTAELSSDFSKKSPYAAVRCVSPLRPLPWVYGRFLHQPAGVPSVMLLAASAMSRLLAKDIAIGTYGPLVPRLAGR
jgi:hypothetical protein